MTFLDHNQQNNVERWRFVKATSLRLLEKFDESKISRDELGRFSFGGGTASDEKPPSPLTQSAGSTRTFKKGDVPKSDNDVPFTHYTPPDDWANVEGQNPNINEPPVKLARNQVLISGLILKEPDDSNRIWLAKPAGEYGGVKYTLPKGHVEEGLSPQANAIKEAFEETGIKARITGFAKEYNDENNPRVLRLYNAVREAGDPTDFGYESEAVVLSTYEDLPKYLHLWRDKDAVKDLAKAFDLFEKFDPDQPRDELGRWTSGGDAGSIADITPELGEKPPTPPPVSSPLTLDPKVVNVGGDKENRDTAIKLETAYQSVKPKLEKIVNDLVKDTPERQASAAPTSWNDLTGLQQDKIELAFKKIEKEKFFKAEADYWYSSGGALDVAKIKIANQHKNLTKFSPWISDVIDEIHEADKLPINADTIKSAITLEYNSTGEGDGDLKVGFRDVILAKFGEEEGVDPSALTEDMRENIAAVIRVAFDSAALDFASELSPPDYIFETAKDLVEQDWDTIENPLAWAKYYAPELLEEAEALEGVRIPEIFDPLNNTSGKNYQETQRLARSLSLTRAKDLIEERLGKGYTNPRTGEVFEGIDESLLSNIDNKLWERWKDSSTNSEGMLLQFLTASELEGKLNTAHFNIQSPEVLTAHQISPEVYEQLSPDIQASVAQAVGLPRIDEAWAIKYADTNYGAIGGWDGLRAYVRAKWETTQYLLDKAGWQELELYRGIRFDEEFLEKIFKQVTTDKDGYWYLPKIEIVKNGAASTSLNSEIANGWGQNSKRVVLRAVIPRTAALSIPAYGVNVHSEKEVVVAGTAWKGWDAFKVRAPGFVRMPLQTRLFAYKFAKAYSLFLLTKFDPDQPRDEFGKWTSGGGGDAGSIADVTPTSGEKPPAPPKAKITLNPKAIDVGGDKKNRATARRLEREYQITKPVLEKLASDIVKKYEGVEQYPGSWGKMGELQKGSAEYKFIDAYVQDHHSEETVAWKESGGALDDAKYLIVKHTNDSPIGPGSWLGETIRSFDKENKTDIVADHNFMNSIYLKYKGDKKGTGKLSIEFTPPKNFTDEKEAALEKFIRDHFEIAAKNQSAVIAPPQYIIDTASDMANAEWKNLADEDKFNWVKANEPNILTEYEINEVVRFPKNFDPLNKTSGDDYKDTQAIAKALSVSRAKELVFERTGVSETKPYFEEIDSQIWHDWKRSSSSENGMLIQFATAEELGGELFTDHFDELASLGNKKPDLKWAKDYANRNYATIGGWEGIKAYTRAKWETTQYLLDKADTNELELYRGVKFDSKFLKKLFEAKQVTTNIRVGAGSVKLLPKIKIAKNGASSTSTNPDIANYWGQNENRVVLRAVVPRTAVLSIPAYGVNVHSEKEVVVAGTAWKGWDAFRTMAPTFNKVRLQEREAKYEFLKAYSLFLLQKFDPDQPRDELGRWTSGGGAGEIGGGLGSGIEGLAPPTPPPVATLQSGPSLAELNPSVVNVGGSASNIATAIRLEREYQYAKPSLERITNEAFAKHEEKTLKVPNSWTALDNQQKKAAKSEYLYKNEVEYQYEMTAKWVNSGKRLDDAKVLFVSEANKGINNQYLFSRYVVFQAKNPDLNFPDLPGDPLDWPTNAKSEWQLKYNSDGKGEGKLDVIFKNPERYTKEQRERFTDYVNQRFEVNASDKAKSMPTPDYQFIIL